MCHTSRPSLTITCCHLNLGVAVSAILSFVTDHHRITENHVRSNASNVLWLTHVCLSTPTFTFGNLFCLMSPHERIQRSVSAPDTSLVSGSGSNYNRLGSSTSPYDITATIATLRQDGVAPIDEVPVASTNDIVPSTWMTPSQNESPLRRAG